ncbi:uncharacterized protein LOC100205374 isoform X2 [Hydra vulgaris]|uniref:Uncharacterized protein LOC100205374 isoform X2 n=1 Tax=Hydra vulgaris TaxID=6087 RepID=A0ABM4D9Q5_HYDVU
MLLRRLLYNDDMDLLPHPIIFSLTLLYFFEAMTNTTVFSYLPQLVKSFGASEVEAGEDAGWIGASIFIARVMSGLVWGYIGDKFNQKKTLLVSSFGLIISTILFGLSRSYFWALITRFMQGVFTGIGPISKTIVSEYANETNMGLAFSIFYAAYNIGLIVGPSLSGFLVFPDIQHPTIFDKDDFFSKYGILLPNLIIAFGLLISNALVMWVLPYSSRKFNPERLLIVSDENCCDHIEDQYSNISVDLRQETSSSVKIITSTKIIPSETSKLINNEKISYYSRLKKVIYNSNFGQVFTSKLSVLSLLLYGVFCIVGVGYLEVFPIFAATSKHFDGLEMTTQDIGLLMLLYNILAILGMFLIIPKILHKLGAKKSFIYWIIGFGSITPFIPAVAMITHKEVQWFVLIICQAVIEAINSGCFVSVNLFLTNSIKPEFQGTINGFGTSISSIGRATGTACFGSTFSWSLSNIKNNKLGFPFNQFFVFLLVTLVCFLNAAYVHFLIPKTLDKYSHQSSEKELVVYVKDYLYL